MEILDYVPTQVKERALPWQEINIMPIGDVQAGAEGCDLERLKRHIKYGIDNNARFIGMGDMTDFLSPSNRDRLKKASLYDTAQGLIDKWHQQHIDELMQVLMPTKGLWIGLHEGHHYHEFTDGTTSDTRIANALDAPFLGTCAITRLRFESSRASVVAHVWSHHGEGAGATTAAPFNKLERVSGFVDADVLLMGHYHRAGVVLTDRLFVSGVVPQLRHRTRALVATGSFLRGYMQGSQVNGRAGGSYVEHGLMPPTAMGNSMITIIPKRVLRKGEDYTTVDLKVTTVSI